MNVLAVDRLPEPAGRTCVLDVGPWTSRRDSTSAVAMPDRGLAFVLAPDRSAALWQHIPGDADVIDIGVEARRRLPKEILKKQGPWETAALAFAPMDSALRMRARARDVAPPALHRATNSDLRGDVGALGAQTLVELVRHAYGATATGDGARRGAFVRLSAAIERRGIPVDVVGLEAFLANADGVLGAAASELGVQHLLGGVGRLDRARLRQLVGMLIVPRRLTPYGEICVDRSALEFASRFDPSLKRVLDFRQVQAVVTAPPLRVDSDGRCRPEMRPFATVTGRCAPRRSPLMLPTFFWMFLNPEDDRALVYVDYVSQEIGIAAALADDPALKRAYHNSDPYSDFALEVARVGSFGPPRSVAKTCMLGLNYGMGAATLAERIGCTEADAKRLREAHRQKFPAYWKWVDATIRKARSNGYIDSVLGWRRVLEPWPGNPSVQNFPVQSAAADILVVAALLIDALGIDIVALNHDAVMVEVRARDAAVAARLVAWAMVEAGREILDGFELRTQATRATGDAPFPRNRGRDERVFRFYEQVLADSLVHEGARHG